VIAFLQEVPDAAKNSTLLARRSTKTAKLGDPAQPDTAASASEHRDDPSPETESRSASDLGCRLPDKSSAHLSPFAADRAGAGGVTTVCAAIVGLYWAWRRFR
jgi:hypothetical protein